MNSSHKVDVVIADGTPTNTQLTPAPPVIETVNVAPDPTRRIIMVSPTKSLGAQEAEALGFEPIAIVTLRSPDAAHGMTADDIIWSDALRTEDRAELEPHVLPTLATHNARHDQ